MSLRRDFRNRSTAYVACTLLGFFLLLSVPTYGQVAGATVSGTVADASGAVIAGVKIDVKDVATGSFGRSRRIQRVSIQRRISRRAHMKSLPQRPDLVLKCVRASR